MTTCTIFQDSNKENCTLLPVRNTETQICLRFKKMEFLFVFGFFGISFTNYIDPQLTVRMRRPQVRRSLFWSVGGKVLLLVK